MDSIVLSPYTAGMVVKGLNSENQKTQFINAELCSCLRKKQRHEPMTKEVSFVYVVHA